MWIAIVFLGAVAVARPVAAVDLDAYRTAARSGLSGEVSGRVYEERRRPDLPEHPLADATIALLPKSDALVERLEQLKRGARDSDDAFRSAVPRMLEVQQEHERAVRAAGGESLLFSVPAAFDGTFRISGIPAGAWLLIARLEALVPKTGHEGTRQDRRMYRVGPSLVGYRTVRLWIRELTVGGGISADIVLTDRNVWFNGIIEVKAERR